MCSRLPAWRSRATACLKGLGSGLKIKYEPWFSLTIQNDQKWWFNSLTIQNCDLTIKHVDLTTKIGDLTINIVSTMVGFHSDMMGISGEYQGESDMLLCCV